MEKIIRERKNLKNEAIRYALEFVRCVEMKLNVKEAYLFGSFARGDFNEWSDIDVLIIVDNKLPKNPIKRIDLIIECLFKYTKIEPIILTYEEFEKLKIRKNPVIEDVENFGIKLT